MSCFSSKVLLHLSLTDEPESCAELHLCFLVVGKFWAASPAPSEYELIVRQSLCVRLARRRLLMIPSQFHPLGVPPLEPSFFFFRPILAWTWDGGRAGRISLSFGLVWNWKVTECSLLVTAPSAPSSFNGKVKSSG